MSKSVLPIHTAPDVRSGRAPRTIEVPCRLPDSFTFSFHLPGYGNAKATALLSDFDEPKATEVQECDLLVGIDSEAARHAMHRQAEAILFWAKSVLGLTRITDGSDVGTNGSPLRSIAFAYEAECAAVEAQKTAWRALPPSLHSLGLAPNEPDAEGASGLMSPASRMLAKYVEHVFEQATKAHEAKP